MQNNWLNKIHNHEILPATVAWQYIAHELDKENTKMLQLKMLAYETNSPAGVLNNIFKQLDTEAPIAPPAFTERIKKYIQTAPAAAWQNIIAKLYKDEKVKQLYPKKGKLTPLYFRLTAAAAAIAIVLLTVISNSKKNTVDTAAVTKPNKTKNALLATTNNSVNAATTPSQQNNQQKKEVAATTSSNKAVTIQPLQTIPTDPIKGDDVEDLAQSPSMNNKEKLKNVKGETPMDIALINAPNNNISTTGANDQTVKTSSKFSNLINSSYSAPQVKENLDIIIEQSPKWKVIIEAWRKKNANNPNPPAINIKELSKLLDDN